MPGDEGPTAPREEPGGAGTLPASGSGVGGPAQALELAPETLAGPALPADARHSRLGPRHDRRAVVHVAGRGGGGPDPRLDRPHDLDDALAIRDEGLHPITCADLGRRLRRQPVYEDVAALAQLRRERTGLHEAHRAQPAVDARLVGGGGIRHAINDPTGLSRPAQQFPTPLFATHDTADTRPDVATDKLGEVMARDEERLQRSQEAPIVGGLPDAPGIVAAIRLTPGVGHHIRGLADELLVKDYPGATLRRYEREMLATAVSAANDCFYCMDTHGAYAGALLERQGAVELMPVIDQLKLGSSDGLGEKMRALLHIARTVRANARTLTAADVQVALDCGATDGDVQLAVLIAAAFSMFNRIVDGLRAQTPPNPAAYSARAAEIAEHGYDDPRVVSLPGRS